MSSRKRENPDRVAAPFFDAHCDAPMKVVDEGAEFTAATARMHVTLPGLDEARVRVQVFASCAVYPETPPDRVVGRGEAMVSAVWAMAAASGGRMAVATCAADLRRAMADGPMAAIIALEGADPLEGKAEGLRRYVERGVRSVIFAWRDNEFAGTAFGTDSPLTREGERLLGLAEDLSTMVDVSHLSDRAFADVCGASTRPFIASHSNCRALCPHPRNLTDAMIRHVADRGGVIGINLAPHFLDPRVATVWATLRADAAQSREELAARRRAVPRPSLEWVARHVVHAIRIGGEDAVGLGGDLDGIDVTPDGIDSVADYVKLVPLLREAGLSERQIHKVCHGNFLRVFGEILG
jgi:membrane dipeptidase